MLRVLRLAVLLLPALSITSALAVACASPTEEQGETSNAASRGRPIVPGDDDGTDGYGYGGGYGYGYGGGYGTGYGYGYGYR